MKIKNIIRVITAGVDNIGGGKSRGPTRLSILRQVFSVGEKDGRVYLDPKSYERYDLLADAFVSLNTSRTVQAYEKVEASLQEAYQELGYPQKDFIQL
jgi:hypothetical protein